MKNRSSATRAFPAAARAEALECRTFLSATFGAASTFPGVVNVTAIAADDLNGDGKPDVVVDGIAPASAVPVVGIYLNNGSGGFETPTLLAFDGSPGGIGIGKFGTGAAADVAVVDSADSQLDVFLGDGAGNFTPGVGGSLGGSGGDTALAVADFNGDGQDDVAVLDPLDNDVVIEFSSADEFGAFSEHGTVSVPDPVALVTADFNGDGHSDLAVASGNGQVYIALNDGTGNFAAPVPCSFGASITSLSSLATADFNGDGFPDLVGLTGSGMPMAMAGVMLNSGTGTFTASTPIATQSDTTLLTTGDFAQTGNRDIATIGSGGSLNIFDGDGAGHFTPDSANGSEGSLGTPIGQAITADFNGDAVPDIAYLSGAPDGGFGVVSDTTGGSTSTSALVPTIAKSTVPAAVVGGTAAHGIATVDIANSSAAAEKGAISIGVYASADGKVDSASVLVGSAKRSGIKAGGTVTAPVTVKLPATLASGVYALLAQVTDPSGGTAVSIAGPSIAVAAPFIRFSETFIKTTLAGSAITGQKSRASVQLKITNNGNVNSTGESTIAIFASPDTTATDGTLIRSLTEPVVIRAGASRTVNVALLNIPAVADGNYYLDAQVTDPNLDVTGTSSAGTFGLNAPFVSLVPIRQSTTIASHGTGTANVTFLLENNGNIASTGMSTFNLYTSTDGTLADATLVFTKQISLVVQPGKQHTFHVQVPAVESTTFHDATTVLMQIVDPFGGTRTAILPF
jgi:hypothetical protein